MERHFRILIAGAKIEKGSKPGSIETAGHYVGGDRIEIVAADGLPEYLFDLEAEAAFDRELAGEPEPEPEAPTGKSARVDEFLEGNVEEVEARIETAPETPEALELLREALLWAERKGVRRPLAAMIAKLERKLAEDR
jgi:hypothetical protein